MKLLELMPPNPKQWYDPSVSLFSLSNCTQEINISLLTAVLEITSLFTTLLEQRKLNKVT